VIQIVQEQIEGLDPLLHARLDDLPVLGREHARNHVERQDAVDRVAIGVDRERDAEIEQLIGGGLGAPPQLPQIHPGEARAHALGMRCGRARAAVEFAPEPVVIVAREWPGIWPRRPFSRMPGAPHGGILRQGETLRQGRIRACRSPALALARRLLSIEGGRAVTAPS
jgi:hypothetical protein